MKNSPSPFVAAIAAGVMSMTAATPAVQAGDFQINFGANNRNVKGGGSDAMARETAKRASAAADKAQSDLKDIQAKLSDAVAKAQAAADASRDISAKLAAIDQRLAALEMAKSATATDDKAPADKKDTEKKDDSRRAPTPEECLAARDAAILTAERTAIAEQAAKLDVQRREADLIVLRLQAQEKRAMADLATARAQEAAAKLALAQAEADREKNRATGLSGDASNAETAVADSQRELDAARSRAADAQRKAADADRLAKAFGAAPLYRSSVITRPERGYEGPTPSWYGEVGPTLSIIPEGARGGLQAGAYARAGEHLAVGLVGTVDGGSRKIEVDRGQNFFGNSVSGAVMAALQIGTVNGENGGNLRVAGGVEKDWQTGVANGLNGSSREGAGKSFGRVDIGAGYVQQISENTRFFIAAMANFLLGRPSRLGGNEQETTVGGTVVIGGSTK